MLPSGRLSRKGLESDPVFESQIRGMLVKCWIGPRVKGDLGLGGWGLHFRFEVYSLRLEHSQPWRGLKVRRLSKLGHARRGLTESGRRDTLGGRLLIFYASCLDGTPWEVFGGLMVLASAERIEEISRHGYYTYLD